MKNVYHDIEIENDSLESLKDIEPMPQFKKVEEAPRKRRVEYDEHGRVRKDYSNKWMKIGRLVIARNDNIAALAAVEYIVGCFIDGAGGVQSGTFLHHSQRCGRLALAGHET